MELNFNHVEGGESCMTVYQGKNIRIFPKLSEFPDSAIFTKVLVIWGNFVHHMQPKVVNQWEF
jgi:hypothetical protein